MASYKFLPYSLPNLKAGPFSTTRPFLYLWYTSRHNSHCSHYFSTVLLVSSEGKLPWKPATCSKAMMHLAFDHRCVLGPHNVAYLVDLYSVICFLMQVRAGVLARELVTNNTESIIWGRSCITCILSTDEHFLARLGCCVSSPLHIESSWSQEL